MRRIYRMTLITALAALATNASAQPLQESRYEMVTTQQDQNVSFGADARARRHYPGWQNQNPDWQRPTGQVVILDKRTGQLWSWYESLQSIMYLGQIFPIAGPGPFARIIQVPEEKTR